MKQNQKQQRRTKPMIWLCLFSFLLLLPSLLAGCSGQTATPQARCESALTAIQRLDPASLQQSLATPWQAEDLPEPLPTIYAQIKASPQKLAFYDALSQLFAQTKWQLTIQSETEQQATVLATITMVDFDTLWQAFSQQQQLQNAADFLQQSAESQEKQLQQLLQSLQQEVETPRLQQREISLNFIKQEGKWLLELSPTAALQWLCPSLLAE